MAESKIFKLLDGITPEMIGREVEGYLRDKKNLTTELLETPEGCLVQAKQADSWKKIAGMDTAIQVQIIPAGDMVTVNVGSGKWADKAGAAAAGMVLFAPLAVTAAIGVWNQKKLPQEIFECVEKFIMSGGKSVYVSFGSSNAIKEGKIICPKCKKPNESNMKFCSACGEKLCAECPHCKASVPLNTKFCPECGQAIEVENLCPSCHAAVPKDKKFCPECGSPMVIDVICSKCHATIPGGKKFCPECGASVTGKKVCANCHAELDVNEKFCPECGTKAE